MMYIDILEKLKQLFFNLFDPQYHQEHLLISMISGLAILAFSVIFLIFAVKATISSASFAKKTCYSVVSFNMLLPAVPTLLIGIFSVLNAKGNYNFIYLFLFVICLSVIILRNIKGCRGNVKFVVYYTITQLFVGIIIGMFGLVAAGIGVFAIVLAWASQANYYSAFNIELTCDSLGAGYDSTVRVMKDPHNSSRLIGSNGDIYELNASGNYVLIESSDTDRLFKQYTVNR